MHLASVIIALQALTHVAPFALVLSPMLIILSVTVGLPFSRRSD